MYKIKMIIFDMDGVIVNYKPVYVKAYKKSLEKYGFEVSNRKIEQALGPEFTEVAERFVKKRNGNLIQKIKKEFDEITTKKENLKKAILLPYVKQILKKLSKEYKIVLLTNADRKVVNIFMRRFGLENFFIKTIVGEDYFKTKEQAIRYVLRKYKISKKEIVYVGDMVRDIKIARNVGCKIISIPGWDSFTKLKSRNPDHLVKNLKGIEKILES